jgi:tetratricopeptide (TPR) repeat protein
VVDAKTGAAVPNAVVKLRMTSEGAGPDVTASDKGRWAVLGISSGNWDIDVDAPGYVTRKLSVAVGGDRVPPIKVELDPAVQEAPAEPQPAPVTQEVKIGGVTVTTDIADAIEAGNALVKQNKFKEAVEQYEKAYPTLSSNLSLKLALARAYYGSGDRKKAIVLLDEAYKADPTNAQTAMLLANLLLEDGQLDRGKTIIEALPGGLNDPMALVNIGILMLNKKQPAAAYDYFSKAIALGAARAESYYYRGLAALQSKKMKEAKADLQKVVELAPDTKEAKDALELLKSIK